MNRERLLLARVLVEMVKLGAIAWRYVSSEK
jgi:hypothetical protein